MANWLPGGPFQWVRPISLLKHTTINLGSAGFWRNQPGDREAAPFFIDGKSMIFVGGEGGGVAFILQPDG